MSTLDIARTYGALLIGGGIAIMLSGVLFIQIIVYFRLYMEDSCLKKTTVLSVWFLDIAHSTFILYSLFDYLIIHFGDIAREDHIPWPIAMSILVTTFLAQCFFVQRIHNFSAKNWLLTIPVLVLVFLRLLAASVSTVEMIRLHRFSAFVRHYPGWVFTTGLSLSSASDIIITTLLCYFMRQLRRQIEVPSRMVHVIDSLTIWTLENGLLTCLTTAASLICWLTMRTNLVFLGLHFVIGKLYANSLVASLNTRKELRQLRAKIRAWGDLPVFSDEDFYTPRPVRRYHPARNLEVTVERTVEHTLEEPRLSLPQSVQSHYSPYSKVHLKRTPTVLEWQRASVYDV
ncbi:hypothetical protein CPB85DRAFT_520037 [Mucidula mucida]|nr:hypothetical protein CPB85DRAFT_520037 [Mucidula mucida]